MTPAGLRQQESYAACAGRAPPGGRAVARPAVIRATNGYVVQLPPFSVNAVGAASLDVQVPWKPTDVEPPGAMVPL